MGKKIVFGLIGLGLLANSTIALAVDDATVQQIQIEATAARNKADGNNSRIQALEAMVADLQEQINSIELQPGPKGDKGDKGDPGQCSEKFELVGHSSSTFKGDGGVIAMSEACQAVFPGSRMCTSEEVMKSKNFGSFNASAWVMPVIVATHTYSDNTAENIDISGVRDWSGRLSCEGWNRAIAPGAGLAVSPNGNFYATGCFNSLRVACCAVVE